MGVGFGSPLSSANTNASLMARNNDTDTTGKLDVLNATDSTATTNGALHSVGGLGVEKKAFINQVYVASLVGDKAVVTGPTKEIVESATTAIELGYVSGATANIQTQINSKAFDSAVVHNTGTENIGGLKTFTDDVAIAAGKDLTVGGDVTITGDLTVNGTTTTVNSATLDVTDTNITVNNGGNDALSEGAGLTIERTGTYGSMVYANALASRFKCGDLASESEVITAATTQSMSGAKTFTNKLNANNELNLSETINIQSGSSVVVPTTTPSIRLTNAALVSVANIDDVTNGKVVLLTNDTTVSISILNDSGGTAAKRIFTGTGANLTLENNKSLLLSYDSNNSRWMVVGGSGSADVSGPASSVASEIVLFDGVTGKLIKAATGTGFVKATSGVYSTQASVSLTTEVSGALPIANGGTNGTTATLGFNNLSPLTIKGDICTRDATNSVRLPVGTNGQVLSSNSATTTGLEWIASPTSFTYSENSDLTLTAADTLAISLTNNLQQWRVQGSAAAIALTSTPFGASAPVSGSEIILIGNDDSFTVSLSYSDTAKGCVGNFSTIELARFQTARFCYNSGLDRWVYV